MRKTFLVLCILSLAGLAAGWGLYRFRAQPPDRQLDQVDSWWPGDSGAMPVKRDILFDREHELRLDIWRPAQGEPPFPVILFSHGGGWHSGARGHYGFAARAFASRGYMAVVPDYRLYPHARFPAFVEDVARAVAWTHDHVANYGGDPDRLFLSGHSAGAYNVMMVALDRQWLGRLGKRTDIIKGVAVLAGPYDFLPLDPGAAQNSFGHWPRPHMTQPVNFARADGPPLLLLHGRKDDVVGLYNSRNLREAVLAAGGDAELIEYPGIDHYDIVMALSRPFRGRAPALADVADWLSAVEQDQR